jgi:hypothetical protein
MKKFIWLLFLTVTLLIGAASIHSIVMAQDMPMTPPPDAALVKTLLQNTQVTTMTFKGSNQNWDCSLTVLEKLETVDNELVNWPKVKIILYPKFTWETYIIRMYEYLITTSNGSAYGYEWLKSGKYITLNTDGPIPESAETITVQITRGKKTDSIEMRNKIPLNIISPEKAFRVTLGVFRATYGSYPTEKFSFYIEFRDSQYWVVSFDNNEGIGGRGYLLVNAYTGDAGDIKEDE